MNRNQFNNDLPPELAGIIILICIILVVVGIAVNVFFLLTLSRCLERVSRSNRRMEPGMVWLNLIPCFGMIWIFFTTTRLADSLQAEYRSRRLRGDGDYGRNLGIAYPILGLCSAIPYLGSCIGLAFLICWIMYWVKISGYSRQLELDDRDYDDQDRDDDRDDYNDRRRRDDDDD